MKSGVSRSFKTIDNRFRVGFNSISYTGSSDTNDKFLHIDRFETSHKYNWYVKLFKGTPTSATPLRGALSKVGKIFAKKLSGAADPIQYSCQQNFSILSTDGYWNTNDEVNATDSSSYGPDKLDNTNVGNLDGAAPRPMLDSSSVSSTLADVAKYYYDTDLRNTSLSNCSGGPVCSGGSSVCTTPEYFDVCSDNVFVSSTDNNVKQHMTSFTIGVGADGTLNYQSDYLTATSGDFYDLKNSLNSKNWPDPIANSGAERIDDLWHAAVNGQGQYFSAKNPNDIVSGLNTALASISAKIGAGAAAATSSLNPVAGDNFVYVASYTTNKWYGNLESRLINLDTGVTSDQATWCVEDVPGDACNAPSTYENDTSGSSNIWYCVTPSQTTCPGGTLVGTDCKVVVNKACTGTLAAKAASGRTIKMNNSGALVDFTAANLSSAGLGANFANNFLKLNLSQAALLSPTQQDLLTPDNLVNYLRGKNDYADLASNPSNNRIFRAREATLGDAVESQPAYISKPPFSYTDTGYSAFVTAQASRTSVVFLGANDGMLHAFNAPNKTQAQCAAIPSGDPKCGEELWAYVPSMVIPNMWTLADKNYSTLHRYYVNGSAIIGDAYFRDDLATTDTWHTILVGSLRGGGRGYYALDVTNPADPKLLWEFTPSNDADLGYSFGDAIITKRPSDKKWVVLVTSGYNNSNGTNGLNGDGKGYLYVLDAKTGGVLTKIGTGEGSFGTPSGLAKIAAWADNAEKDNTVKWVYGGDLFGNLWRFDMTTNTAFKFAVLKDPSNQTQPITTRPELARIFDKRVVYVGTGKYLEKADLLTNQVQTFYAIKDDDAAVTFTDPRDYDYVPIPPATNPNRMIEQELVNVGANRTATCNTNPQMNFAIHRGFYLDLPDSYHSTTSNTDASERVNIDPQLQFGTLLIPTTVPASDICSPGGYGWLNYIDYKTGCAVTGSVNAGQKTNSPIVGFNVITLPPKPGVSLNQRIKVSVVTADNPTPQLIGQAPFNATLGSFVGKRAVWRELIR